jgi:PAS domain S-box-containing protein
LFAYTVLVAILLGFRPALWAIILNAVSLSIFAWLIASDRLPVDFVFFGTPQAMVAAGVNFLVLNAVAAVSVAVLVKGLVDTSENKAELAQRLSTERSQLIDAKNALESEIGERRQVQQTLIHSEEKYRRFVDNAPIGMFTINAFGEFTYANKKLLELTGYRIQEWLGKPFHPIVHPDDLHIAIDKMNRRINGNADPGPYEIRIYHSSGETRWVEIVSESILSAGDGGESRLVGMQSFVTDITSRKRAEQALRDSEEKYKGLVRHAPTGIYEFDMQTLQFVSVNDVMCQYTGYSEKEFLELDPFDIICGESKETLTRLIEDVFSNRPGEISTEYKIKGKNGRVFWVLANARFFYEDDRPVRAMVVVHDLTDIRQAEAERKELEVQLQNARKLESLGTLAGGVAHDLNNILSGVVSYPDLLLMDLDAKSPLRGPLTSIKQSGEKAAEIVQDLLTLARRGVASRKVISLNQIIHDFMASPEASKIAQLHPNVSIETRLGAEVLNVVGSEVHLAKTAMNLIANAADAMPAGGKAVIATRSRYLDTVHHGYEQIPEGEYTLLEVSDQGIGIPTADLEKIFEPFYTKKAMGRSGTGLGMSVVWGTVKDHDGYIDVVTEEGSGTMFTLYLPASRAELELPSTVHIDDYLGRGESILVVDDSPEQRSLAQKMMQRLGYEVATADSGEEAVSMVKTIGGYDLLILDMIMPTGMNGLATYQQILDIVPGQRAVIASGYAMSDDVYQTQQLGAGEYIKKPFTLEKIGLAVRTELDKDMTPPPRVKPSLFNTGMRR